MQHEKKRRHHRKHHPEVNVRVKVRPLRANWKPVKLVEFSGVSPTTDSPGTHSPAQDQLDSNVWKTKHVRTEFVEEKCVESSGPSDESEASDRSSKNPETACSRSERNGHSDPNPNGNEKSKIPGLVDPCSCSGCRQADDSVTSAELSPEKNPPARVNKRNKNKKKRAPRRNERSSRKSSKPPAPQHPLVPLSAPPPPPPNSVASRDSQRKWCKLYEEVCRPPMKPIDVRKLPSIPGQIGLSELTPENPDLEPERIKEETDPLRSPIVRPNAASQFAHPSPKVMKRPLVSPVSSFDHTQPSHQPPLIPQQTLDCEPPNVKPPPVDAPPGIVSSMVQKVMGTTTTTTGVPLTRRDSPAPPNPPPKSSKSVKSSSSFTLKSIEIHPNGSRNEALKTAIDTQGSPLSPMPLTIVSSTNPNTAKVSIFRQMELVFYGSETSLWLFVALVMLTIFAYRSSIEQHTCYYD